MTGNDENRSGGSVRPGLKRQIKIGKSKQKPHGADTDTQIFRPSVPRLLLT